MKHTKGAEGSARGVRASAFAKATADMEAPHYPNAP
jgi:hypothetical protein